MWGRDRRDEPPDVTSGAVTPLDEAGDSPDTVSSRAGRDALRHRVDAAMILLSRGDRTQFSLVFGELWPVVSRRCAQWLGDADEGEDAAQRALIALMGRAHEYREGESALSWALTLAMWECRTVRRRRARSRLDPVDRALDLAEPAPDPEDAAIAREMKVLARAAFERLAPAEQLLLAGAVREELGGAGPLSPAMRKRKQRVLDRLRKLWSRNDGD